MQNNIVKEDAYWVLPVFMVLGEVLNEQCQKEST